ncbi:hypothetical protein [Klebsiella michiganensis]|uniref:hypothetical protein n=1 Tax=Klebsiella michiganensis TaxID=1134687 RepID=UPI00155FD742|nr:hypothetical protein [Klebsiella michiganensis]NRG21111.1 hypothetical protein [Klebsiella michiganensis]
MSMQQSSDQQKNNLLRENSAKTGSSDTKKARLNGLFYAAFYAGQNQKRIVTY